MTLAATDSAATDSAATRISVGGEFRRTAVSGYAYAVVGLLVAAVVTPLLARGLGPVQFGIWSVIGASVSYLEVLELGFGTATVTVVAGREATGDREGTRRAVATSFWVLAVPGALALGAGALAAWALPSLLDLAPNDVTPTRLLLLLLALDLAVSIPGDTFGGVLAGLRRIDLVVYSLLAGAVVTATAWLVVLAAGGGLVALGVATAGVGLAGQGGRLLLARRLVPGLSLSPRLVRRAEASEMGRLSGWFAVSDLNRLVVQRLDIVLVGAVVGIEAAGIYAVAQKLVSLVPRCVDPVTGLLFPHAAGLQAHGDAGALRATLLAACQLSLAVAVPLAVGLGFFATPLLGLWVGADFAGAREAVVLLSLAAVASSMAAAVQLVLKGMREARAAAGGASADAVVNLVLSVALGLLLGAAGVAMATLAAALVAVGVLLPAACRATGLALRPLGAAIARAHLLPLAAAGVLALALRRLTPTPGLLVLPEAVAVVVLHAALLVRTALEPAQRARLLAAARAWRVRRWS